VVEFRLLGHWVQRKIRRAVSPTRRHRGGTGNGRKGACVDGPRRARGFWCWCRSVGCRHVSGLFSAAPTAAGP